MSDFTKPDSGELTYIGDRPPPKIRFFVTDLEGNDISDQFDSWIDENGNPWIRNNMNREEVTVKIISVTIE